MQPVRSGPSDSRRHSGDISVVRPAGGNGTTWVRARKNLGNERSGPRRRWQREREVLSAGITGSFLVSTSERGLYCDGERYPHAGVDREQFVQGLSANLRELLAYLFRS